MSSSSARTESVEKDRGTNVRKREVRVRGIRRGICFETHPAGASRRYSGRYKPATKSSVCDTLIIGRIYGVHIVLTDTDIHARSQISIRGSYMLVAILRRLDIRREMRVRMCARTRGRMCTRVHANAHMPARLRAVRVHTRVSRAYTRPFGGRMIVGR